MCLYCKLYRVLFEKFSIIFNGEDANAFCLAVCHVALRLAAISSIIASILSSYNWRLLHYCAVTSYKGEQSPHRFIFFDIQVRLKKGSSWIKKS